MKKPTHGSTALTLEEARAIAWRTFALTDYARGLATHEDAPLRSRAPGFSVGAVEPSRVLASGRRRQRVRLSDALGQFVVHCQAQHARRTVQAYRTTNLALLAHMGDLYADQLGAIHIDRWFAHLRSPHVDWLITASIGRLPWFGHPATSARPPGQPLGPLRPRSAAGGAR